MTECIYTIGAILSFILMVSLQVRDRTWNNFGLEEIVAVIVVGTISSWVGVFIYFLIVSAEYEECE